MQIEHEKEHNFTETVNQIAIDIEKKIENGFTELIKMGKRRILFTRVNPRKRTIQIKYIFNEHKDNSFFELKSLGIKKEDLYNKNLKIKFFIVYHFVLKLNKEEKEKGVYHLYNNSAKVYFNIGHVGSVKKIHEDEDFIRKKLYKIFLNGFIPLKNT